MVNVRLIDTAAEDLGVECHVCEVRHARLPCGVTCREALCA